MTDGDQVEMTSERTLLEIVYLRNNVDLLRKAMSAAIPSIMQYQFENDCRSVDNAYAYDRDRLAAQEAAEVTP